MKYHARTQFSKHLFFHSLLIFLFWLAGTTCSHAQTPGIHELPEIDEINSIIDSHPPPSGVLFIIYEYEYDALEWVVPRLSEYVRLLREQHPDLAISVVSHGDEMLALPLQEKHLFPRVHKEIQELAEKYQVPFHVCGAYAAFNGLSEEDFPDYIDVVPFGPAQINDYKMVGYEAIDLGLTW
jgi:intracellular sulfur oxidation DsrE/DsrF family protein